MKNRKKSLPAKYRAGYSSVDVSSIDKAIAW